MADNSYVCGADDTPPAILAQHVLHAQHIVSDLPERSLLALIAGKVTIVSQAELCRSIGLRRLTRPPNNGTL